MHELADDRVLGKAPTPTSPEALKSYQTSPDEILPNSLVKNSSISEALEKPESKIKVAPSHYLGGGEVLSGLSLIICLGL